MNRGAKPKFAPYQTWGACSRCGARVAYNTLRRERLTGLLMCTAASGRPVRPCWDPWPAVYDFQAYPDKSIEPPPEPLPARWGMDNIWGNGPATGTTRTFATAPQFAPDDATRLQQLLRSVPYYAQLGKTASFASPNPTFTQTILDATQIIPANWDGTFIPSGSVRTVLPPDPTETAAALQTASDPDVPDKIWSPPWATVKGV